MGSEISNKVYTQKDFKAFKAACLKEHDYIKSVFSKGAASFSNTYRLGYELEVCILDEKNRPLPANREILQDIDSPLFTNELAKYNMEINGNVFALDHKAPENLAGDLHALWSQANRSASKYHAQLALFGVLPSLEMQHFDMQTYQSEMHRYTLVSKRMNELRHESIKILFHGEDEIALTKEDVMLEALGTSLQVHLQIPFDKAVDYYHASLIASVVLVGFSANSSLVLEKRGWHESRIPIFEQSVDTRDKKRRAHGDEKRVHFAHGYIGSWMDLFEQNNDFKIIFADVQDKPVEALHHFNLHNGTIWRWVRPIFDTDKEGKHTLRLELRALPSGPTLIDIEANIWFLIGLIEGLILEKTDLTKLPFETLKNDFYHIAKYGLNSEFHEPIEGKRCNLKTWILSEGIRLTKQGLSSFDIDASKFLDIIENRTANEQNGAIWQLKHFEKHHNIPQLMVDYLRQSQQNKPVHTWSL
jgi:gamma-glutamyl:cysteine ligase YbdK (ATP-grasp superfamily)